MMGKQFVNIVGLVVVVAVAVAGILLIGLPLVSDSFATGAKADQVDVQNASYQAQVAALQKEKEDFSTLKADVAALRAQVPSTNRLDDVFELVAKAATATGVSITTVTASDAVPWTERTVPTADGTPAPVPGGAASGSTGTATPAPTPAPSATPAAGEAASTSGTAQSAQPSGQLQVPFVITIGAPTSKAAIQFVDDLRKGPRLLGIVETTMAPETTGAAYVVTVKALAFVRTEK